MPSTAGDMPVRGSDISELCSFAPRLVGLFRSLPFDAARSSASRSTSVAADNADKSTPERSASDLCNASNIRLMFARLNGYGRTQIGLDPDRSSQSGIKIRDRPLWLAGFHSRYERRTPLASGELLHFKAELLRHVLYDVRSHTLHLPCIGSDEGVFTNCVDQAGKASRMPIYSRNSLLRKQSRSPGTLLPQSADAVQYIPWSHLHPADQACARRAILCFSCLSPTESSFSSSSGWPTNTICSNLSSAVSRFVRRRTSSSISADKWCASSTMSTVVSFLRSSRD